MPIFSGHGMGRTAGLFLLVPEGGRFGPTSVRFMKNMIQGGVSMATLQQLRQGLGEMWSSVVEGWRRLTERAASAVTRFSPSSRDGGNLPELRQRSIGWGVLAAEVFDDDARVVVRMEVPGMKRSDLDVEVIDDLLVVRGRKRMERESTHGRYHVLECAYGRFERAIPLPARVDGNAARAKYRRGVLRIELPKLKEFGSGLRSIPIR